GTAPIVRPATASTTAVTDRNRPTTPNHATRAKLRIMNTSAETKESTAMSKDWTASMSITVTARIESTSACSRPTTAPGTNPLSHTANEDRVESRVEGGIGLSTV